jgi:hypothetical protein
MQGQLSVLFVEVLNVYALETLFSWISRIESNLNCHFKR